MGLGEKASEISVPARNSARGSHMRGSLSFTRDASSVTKESPSRVCDAVIDIRIVTAEAKAKQKEA
jgi:hypothetical protein